jgi:hypothetical protein
VTLGDLVFSLDLTTYTLSLFPSLTEGTVKKEKRGNCATYYYMYSYFSLPFNQQFYDKKLRVHERHIFRFSQG